MVKVASNMIIDLDSTTKIVTIDGDNALTFDVHHGEDSRVIGAGLSEIRAEEKVESQCSRR